MDKKRLVFGHILAMVTIMVWGTTYVATKVLLVDFKPVEILFIRFFIGLITLVIIYPKRMKIKSLKQELVFAAAGLCGLTMYYLFENIALTYTMASNVGVIISAAPFFTAILTHFFLPNEKGLSKSFVAGFVIAMIGICLITFNGTRFKLNPVGDLLAFIAAMVWACYSVLSKKAADYGYNTIQVTRRIFIYGIVFMLPTLWLFDFNVNMSAVFEYKNLLNFVFLGMGASALCFVTWNYAVKLLGAVKTSVYIYMSPVVTLVTSMIVLKEKITLLLIAGMVLTLSGLLLSGDIIFKRK